MARALVSIKCKLTVSVDVLVQIYKQWFQPPQLAVATNTDKDRVSDDDISPDKCVQEVKFCFLQRANKQNAATKIGIIINCANIEMSNRNKNGDEGDSN